jgi:hypothetical protein
MGRTVRSREIVMASQSKERMDLGDRAEVCTATVVYDDAIACDLAIELCQRLARKFSGDLEFEFTWWGLKYLSDPEIASQAAQVAMKADLIIFSIHKLEALPLEIETWFERWIRQRAPGGGALVVLRQPKAERSWIPLEQSYFEALAQRASLDYVQLSLPGAEPRLVDRPREEQVFSEMTGRYQVPEHLYHSSGWGIDE